LFKLEVIYDHYTSLMNQLPYQTQLCVVLFLHLISTAESSYVMFITLGIILLTRMIKKSRKMRWVSHVVRIGAMRSTYNTMVGKPEEK